VHALDPRGHDALVLRALTTVGTVAPLPGGALLVGLSDTLALVPGTGLGPRELARTGCRGPGQRINDGALDPAGRFVLGTIAGAVPGGGRLLRWDGARLDVLRDGLAVSNGIGWSPAGDVMYHVDTPTMRVDRSAYQPDTGRLGEPRPLAELAGPGRPDGLAVDDDGCVWVAMIGSGTVLRLTPAGRVDRRVAFPASRVTSCAFGGADGRTLYVTSARKGVAPGRPEPLAGAVFAVRTPVSGLASITCGRGGAPHLEEGTA
jgi:sugar lactone lactonase YvrE